MMKSSATDSWQCGSWTAPSGNTPNIVQITCVMVRVWSKFLFASSTLTRLRWAALGSFATSSNTATAPRHDGNPDLLSRRGRLSTAYRTSILSIMSKKSPPPTFEPIKPTRAHEAVLAQLQRKILEGELDPGDR